MNEKEKRDTILIVDDTEFNRELLSAILSEDYQILEAENGVQAVKLMELRREEISLVLLDIMMPEMDGFEFLEYMNLRGWIESIPVIMLSSENTSDFLERAYAWRVTDFISRPFDTSIVRRRAANTIALYSRQRRLEDLVERQLEKREKGQSADDLHFEPFGGISKRRKRSPCAAHWNHYPIAVAACQLANGGHLERGGD